MTDVTIDELALADDPHTWERLGFTVSDGGTLLDGVRLTFTGARSGAAIEGWTLRGAASTELDGLPTRLATPEASGAQNETRRGPAVHPNGVVAIDHVVAVSPWFERSVQTLRSAGLNLRRVREEPAPKGAPRQAFFRLGGVILELVAEPEDVVVRSGGPDRPARFWGLALLCEDIDSAAATFAPHAGAVRDAVQPGRRIATLARSAGLAVPVALISPAPRGQAAVR